MFCILMLDSCCEEGNRDMGDAAGDAASSSGSSEMPLRERDRGREGERESEGGEERVNWLWFVDEH